MANAIVGMALGLFLRAFARTEFQAVLRRQPWARFWLDVVGAVGMTVLALALGAPTLRRRTP